jgi:trans-aconitate methyltransferase
MNVTERNRVNEYHLKRIRESNRKGDPRVLGYLDDVSQQARFEVISSMFDFSGKCVLDVGCGYGQLREYLSRRHRNFEYIGIDQQIEFIHYALARYEHDEKCRFVAGDFSDMELPRSDVVVASGALSYRCEDSEYYTRCIEKFFQFARSALIINMLDRSKMFPDELIVGHDIQKTKKFCQTLTPNIVIVTGYLYSDVTLMLSR